MSAHPAADVRLGFDALVTLLEGIFLAYGTSRAVAAVLARNCAGAERDGVLSHGVFRMAGYVSTLNSGWVDGAAVPAVQDAAGAFIRVDARNGFAQPALAAAADLAVARARALGISLVAIHNSHHFGALSLDVEPFAAQGLIALSMVNSMVCVVPHGARRPVYGTNPIAFAAPRGGGHPPIVFDQATSTMANGDVQLARREHRQLPPGTGVDSEGQPTQDPARVLDGGALLTFGGHKGSSISLMIELLSAALTGGKFSFEVDLSAHPGAHTPHTGQVVILIDPGTGAGSLAPFASRVEMLVAALHEAGQDRLPGDRRHAARRLAMAEGIPLSPATLDTLRALAPKA